MNFVEWGLISIGSWSISILQVKTGASEWVVAVGTEVRGIGSQGEKETLWDRTGKLCLTSYKASLSSASQCYMFHSDLGGLFFFRIEFTVLQ